MPIVVFLQKNSRLKPSCIRVAQNANQCRVLTGELSIMKPTKIFGAVKARGPSC